MEKELLFGEENREIEILEFTAGGNSYGMDISDIREILPYENNATRIPNSHPNIEGIIMPRDFLIPIVNVVNSLKLTKITENDYRMIIVSSINNLNIAFLVDEVVGMHHTNTGDLEKPGKKLSTTVKGVVTSILNINNKKIEMLEPRKIIADINPNVDLG